MTENMEAELRALIARVVKIPEEKVTLDANLFSDLGIDSLLGVEIFAALDQKYQIDIPEDKLRDVKTLRDILALVEGLKK
ncbi:MAG: acyl carrier protein [Candidatus Saganbacteria bacterium]|nr:acyl carrier protein [Candidatus Saganbacteria bacterium]